MFAGSVALGSAAEDDVGHGLRLRAAIGEYFAALSSALAGRAEDLNPGNIDSNVRFKFNGDKMCGFESLAHDPRKFGCVF